MDEFAQQLHEALVGAGDRPPGTEVAALVRLARQCERIVLPGPTTEQVARMRRRLLERTGDGRGRTWPLVDWLGFGPQPRPLAQRLAAGLAVAAIAFSGASAAAGTTPWDAAVRAGEILVDAARNLRPGGDPAPGEPTATVTPTPTAGATAGGTAEPTPTPDPTAEGDDGGQRGRGSEASGGDRERTPEPGDDRRSD